MTANSIGVATSSARHVNIMNGSLFVSDVHIKNLIDFIVYFFFTYILLMYYNIP